MNVQAETQIAHDEGESLVPYQDLEGWWTIGVGHCLGTKDKDEIPSCFASGITQQQCDHLFVADLEHTESLLCVYIPWWRSLSDPRSAVLLNMAFNLGVTGLCGFKKFLAALKNGDFQTAAAELEDSKAFRQLPNRYGRLKQQILTGNWQGI